MLVEIDIFDKDENQKSASWYIDAWGGWYTWQRWKKQKTISGYVELKKQKWDLSLKPKIFSRLREGAN